MPHPSPATSPPPGLVLRHTLYGHGSCINRIAWSPDGRILASCSYDQTIKLWDTATGGLLRTLSGHAGEVWGLAWSPDGKQLASGAEDRTVRLWDAAAGPEVQRLEGHTDAVYAVAWSPGGTRLASGSRDRTVRVWEAGQTVKTLIGHSEGVNSVVWSPDGESLATGSYDCTARLWDMTAGKCRRVLTGHTRSVNSLAWWPGQMALASGSSDHTVRIWHGHTAREMRVLEGHAGRLIRVAFSPDGRLLASKSWDNTVRLWRCDTWETAAVLDEPFGAWHTGLAFHPQLPMLATLGEKDTVLRIWDFKADILLRAESPREAVHYTNAKVFLVGETGVGKSGLALVLAGQRFAPTESTHAHRVWTLASEQVVVNGRPETREVLLWDLAGQHDYRLIHQLHLNEVAVALVVFDVGNTTDPFAEVYYWDRALRQAQRVQGDAAPPLKKFLVAARTDRGGISASRARIDKILSELGFAGYFATSAKEGRNIVELSQAIRTALDWSALPRVTSTDLFRRIKDFLRDEREREHRVLSTADDLYRAFVQSGKGADARGDLRAQFETCVGRLEAQGLIRRLTFGNLVLLLPALLDAYASAIIIAAKDEPEGFGSIAEDDVRAGRFRMSDDERIEDRSQEPLLLLATVEDLVRHEIALREPAADGPVLVFPSQLTRENPDLPDPPGKAVVFTFEGPVLSVYATLIVRLSHSGAFARQELWKNAATYTATVGGTCGLWLREVSEGKADLTLFFDGDASEETRFQFEDYVHTHLRRRALPESIQRRRVFVCRERKVPVTDQQAGMRRQRGFDWIVCGVCGGTVSLLDREERLAAARPSLVDEMDRAADARRNLERAASTLRGKLATKDFDVFLCHHGADKAAVKQIGEQLKARGILPWLDEWNLRPGDLWPDVVVKILVEVKTAAIFIGPGGAGPWQDFEIRSLLRRFAEQHKPLIPVLLPGVAGESEIPDFLKDFTWVDFRKEDPDPLERLVWGITGKQEDVLRIA